MSLQELPDKSVVIISGTIANVIVSMQKVNCVQNSY